MIHKKTTPFLLSLFILNLCTPVQLESSYKQYAIGSTCALLLACLKLGLNYTATSHLKDRSAYSPSGEYKAKLEKTISECGLDPKEISLRYGYCGHMIALSSTNAVIMDPLYWKNTENDTSLIEAKKSIEKNVIPLLSEQEKNISKDISDHLTPDAQNFIFKHELGHMHNKTSYRLLSALFLQDLSSCLLGINTSIVLFNYLKKNLDWGHDGSLLVSSITYLTTIVTSRFFSNYFVNYFVEYSEELSADEFAIKHSSPEELKAAAQFFTHFKEMEEKLLESTTVLKLLSKSPTLRAIYLGHMHHTTRIAKLEKAGEKQLSKHHILDKCVK